MENGKDLDNSIKKNIFGLSVGLLMSILFTLSGVTVQALDSLVPMCQLNTIRLAGKTFLGLYHLKNKGVGPT